ncbi:unnamed protein product, partial [Laminaria digitata]
VSHPGESVCLIPNEVYDTFKGVLSRVHTLCVPRYLPENKLNNQVSTRVSQSSHLLTTPESPYFVYCTRIRAGRNPRPIICPTPPVSDTSSSHKTTTAPNISVRSVFTRRPGERRV